MLHDRDEPTLQSFPVSALAGSAVTSRAFTDGSLEAAQAPRPLAIQATDFVHAAVTLLKLRLDDLGDGLFELTIPADQTSVFADRDRITIRLGDSTGPASHPGHATPPETDRTVESTAPEALLFGWLVEQIQAAGGTLHARPADQPNRVHEVAGRLFDAYEVEGGSAHIAGCTLEDRPFLLLTLLRRAPDCPPQITTAYFAADGKPLSSDRINQLGLDTLAPLGEPRPKIPASQIKLLTAAGKRALAAHPDHELDHPIAATILWAKYVTGRLQFTIGEASAILRFEGWARTLDPPPFVCQHSRLSTYRVAATDDGRIVAAEAIEVCEHSGRRTIGSELTTCCVTGKRVLKEFVAVCPALGKPALIEEFIRCPRCRQEVCQAAIEGPGCRGCMSLQRVDRDDPRMVWLLGEFPQLDRFRHFELSETAQVYILQTRGWWKKLLLVLDRESLEVRHAATQGRFGKEWLPIDDAERRSLLGS